MYPIINDNEINFKLVGDGYDEIPKDFNSKKGTISRSNVTCPVCDTTIESKKTRELFQKKHVGKRIIAIVTHEKGKSGKNYRLATLKDYQTYLEAEKYLNKKILDLYNESEINPIPDEIIPKTMTGCIAPPNYGMYIWGDLFNSRQKLFLVTLIEKITFAHSHMNEENYSYEYSKVITTFLALLMSRIADYSSMFCHWQNTSEVLKQSFVRPAFGMVWDHVEGNPFSPGAGSLKSFLKANIKSIDQLSKVSSEQVHVFQSSATKLKCEDNFFDAVFTDPPYYNSVPYADLSDFFYVWLKRCIGNLYPSLFATPLTPKTNELAEMSTWDKKRYGYKTKEYFEENLKESFKEIFRVLKLNGIATIVYAHKTTEGWETVINALLDSGLTITASWPISTELASRIRAQKSASLASSIYIIARKYEKQEIGWFKDVKDEIKEYVPKKLDKLWEDGISGADFFIAAIGSAIEIFGKYEKVLDNEGNEIRADKLLSYVRDVVTDYTVRHILHNGIADELSPLTKFYLLWRWNYQEARVPFDEARKIAQSAGIDLTNEWNKGFILKRGEFITIQAPDKRDKKSLENSTELIDVIHHVCLLWKQGKLDEIKSVLKNSGYGNKEAFYKVAQAISETLPNNSSEKKQIEGFLLGKDRIIKDMGDDISQTKLV